MHSVLIGNYGVGNLGDEALREYFLLEYPETMWTVLSACPVRKGEVPRLPFGVRSFFSAWWKTLIAISSADCVVFGGGSLFTDSESVFACMLWAWHALVARVLGVPVILAFQGVGPFRTRTGRFLSRSVFQSAEFISVRDEASLQRLSGWDLHCTPTLTFDPVFSVFSHFKKTASSRNILVIIPRENSAAELFNACVLQMKNVWDEIRILRFQSRQEARITAEILVLVPHARTIDVTDVSGLMTHLRDASFVVTERYHGALAALALGIPRKILSQVAGDKLDELRSVQRDPQGIALLLRQVEEGEDALRKYLNEMGK